MKKIILLTIFILIVAFSINGFTADNWVSPTSGSGYGWSIIPYAYDENLNNATAYDTGDGCWSGFLTLTISAIECDKVRFNVYYSDSSINEIDLDVFWSGAWHNIYQGSMLSREWVEKSLNGTYIVTQARMRFYNDHDESYRNSHVYEFDFNEVVTAPPDPPRDINDWVFNLLGYSHEGDSPAFVDWFADNPFYWTVNDLQDLCDWMNSNFNWGYMGGNCYSPGEQFWYRNGDCNDMSTFAMYAMNFYQYKQPYTKQVYMFLSFPDDVKTAHMIGIFKIGGVYYYTDNDRLRGGFSSINTCVNECADSYPGLSVEWYNVYSYNLWLEGTFYPNGQSRSPAGNPIIPPGLYRE